MKTEIRRDAGRNYLIFTEYKEPGEGYFWQILLNHSIEGLLPLRLRAVNNYRESYYDINDRQSLKWLLAHGDMEWEQIKEILQAIGQIMKQGENYLLKAESYVLEADTIFLDLTDFSVQLCYLPGYEQPLAEKWQKLTEYLMNTVNYKKEETILYVYGLYKAARENGDFWAAVEETAGGLPNPPRVEAPEFEERIEVETQVEKYPARLYIMGAGMLAAAILFAVLGLLLWKPSPVQAGAFLLIIAAFLLYGLSRLFVPEHRVSTMERQVEYIPVAAEGAEGTRTGGTKAGRTGAGAGRITGGTDEIATADEATVILNAVPTAKSCFLRAENSRQYQDIELFEFPFFFGKLKTQVNSTIESPAVSRFHAKIERLGGEYYLVDLNSTNGTYLNGERLNAHERRRLEPMDRIHFADVGYFFDGGKEGYV